MPAVTVDDIASLPRIATPAASAVQRPVVSVTTAPQGLEGEGFPVHRAFAGVDQRLLDPFVHMDQMGAVEYAPGEPKGTPWHPHRGFETVTYMIDGTFAHEDSNGGGGLITNGDTQWMTAGAGILHIETPPSELVASGGLFHGIQLWVNLPAAEKWANPRYQDIRAGQVGLLSSADGGALIRVIAGQVGGGSGPGLTHTPMAMTHITVNPGEQVVLPWSPDHNALVYTLSGRGTVGPEFAADQQRSAGCARRRRRPHHPGRRQPGEPQPRARRARSRRPPDPRGDRLVRAVRHEHAGRAAPGVRRLPRRQDGRHPRRPLTALTVPRNAGRWR